MSREELDRRLTCDVMVDVGAALMRFCWFKAGFGANFLCGFFWNDEGVQNCFVRVDGQVPQLPGLGARHLLQEEGQGDNLHLCPLRWNWSDFFLVSSSSLILTIVSNNTGETKGR
jgi:hypothetical protein